MDNSLANYVIVWVYEVIDAYHEPFMQAYGSDGDWVQFFRQSEFYLGTKLYQDENQPNRYITMDYWVSEETYQNFIEQWQGKYQTLDKQFEALTTTEKFIGRFKS